MKKGENEKLVFVSNSAVAPGIIGAQSTHSVTLILLNPHVSMNVFLELLEKCFHSFTGLCSIFKRFLTSLFFTPQKEN